MAGRSPLINVMTQAAQKAGRALIRDFGEVEQLQVSRKGPADFVSNADRRAEEIIYGELSKARPAYGFLMEERGAVDGSDTSNRWIVDPLDGTTNFLHGLPHFAVSIALERDGDLFAGVVYEPVHDELYWAEKGDGARLNGHRLRVSGRQNLADCVIATGIPFMGESDHPAFLDQMAAVMDATAGIRRFGVASLDLAYVAAGRFDGYWESNISPWDVAAGIVLVREAGGYVSDLDSGRQILQRGDILAANDHLHAPLARLIDGTSPTAE